MESWCTHAACRLNSPAGVWVAPGIRHFSISAGKCGLFTSKWGEHRLPKKACVRSGIAIKFNNSLSYFRRVWILALGVADGEPVIYKEWEVFRSLSAQRHNIQPSLLLVNYTFRFQVSKTRVRCLFFFVVDILE